MRTQVINNRESLVQTHVPPTLKALRKKKGAKRQIGEPQVGPLISLKPGMNLVDSDLLSELREVSPLFDELFKTRIEPSPAPEQNPEMVGRPILVKGIEVADEAPLAKMRPAAAKAMISETLDTDMLRDWLKEEARPEVRRALDAKITSIEKPMASKARRNRDDDE